MTNFRNFRINPQNAKISEKTRNKVGEKIPSKIKAIRGTAGKQEKLKLEKCGDHSTSWGLGTGLLGRKSPK